MGAGHNAFKQAIKRQLKGVAAFPGRWLHARGPCSRILTYHSIGLRPHEMNVPPSAFREQMEWLVSNVRIMPLEEAAQGVPGVALTFDDGYRDNLANAAPVLRELGMPATFFVVPGCAGRTLGPHEDPATGALMDWAELAALQAMGFQIGAHSMTHAHLSRLPEKEQRCEIADSRRILEGRLDCAIHAFAYPYGSAADFTEATKRLVRECGFQHAVSNRYGVIRPGADRWALRRIWVDSTDDLKSFQAKVEGDLDVLSVLDWGPVLAARTVLNRMCGL